MFIGSMMRTLVTGSERCTLIIEDPWCLNFDFRTNLISWEFLKSSASVELHLKLSPFEHIWSIWSRWSRGCVSITFQAMHLVVSMVLMYIVYHNLIQCWWGLGVSQDHIRRELPVLCSNLLSQFALIHFLKAWTMPLRGKPGWQGHVAHHKGFASIFYRVLMFHGDAACFIMWDIMFHQEYGKNPADVSSCLQVCAADLGWTLRLRRPRRGWADYRAAEVIPDDFPDLEKRFGDNPESKASDPTILDILWTKTCRYHIYKRGQTPVKRCLFASRVLKKGVSCTVTLQCDGGLLYCQARPPLPGWNRLD